MSFSYTSPSVPFKGDILDGLSVESEIVVMGQTQRNADSFSVNLCSQHDVPFHFNPRFSQEYVVRNHLVAGDWGPEEKHPHGMDELIAGRSFEITIRTEESHYQVSINGHHMLDFVHRLSFESVQALYITGDVILNRVDYTVNEFKDPPPAYSESADSAPQTQPIPVRVVSRPFRNPVIPVLYPILGGVKAGYVFKIIGKPKDKAIRFQVDLVCGPGPFPPSDIALHVKADFNSSLVVRNTCVCDHWGPEECCGPPFPFRRGANFEIVLTAYPDFFEIIVDGKSSAIYQHRVMPLKKIDYISVSGDVEVLLMEIERTALFKQEVTSK